MFATIMAIINISSLILIAIGYFRDHYTIVSLEQWNELAHFYNEHQETDEDNCGGGVGFYIPTDETCLYEDDEDEDVLRNHRKIGF